MGNPQETSNRILRDYTSNIQKRIMKITKDWLVGFVDGEGCFYVAINNSKSRKTTNVQLEFTIVQHKRDINLLYAIKDFFECGLVRPNKNKTESVWAFRVRDRKSLETIIIPFFEANPLLTTKSLNFLKFKQIYSLVKDGQHLSKQGLHKIRVIKSTMNRLSEVTLLDKDIVPTLLKDKE